MKITFYHLHFLIIFAMIGSGCSSFTRMRYSRGFKSEISLFSDKDLTTKAQTANVAKKIKPSWVIKSNDTLRKFTTEIPALDSATQTVHDSENDNIHFRALQPRLTNIKTVNGIAQLKETHTRHENKKQTGEYDNLRPWRLLATFLVLIGICVMILAILSSLSYSIFTIGFISLIAGLALGLVLFIIYIFRGGLRDWWESLKGNWNRRILYAIISIILLGIIALL